jgi:hypothetical protein
MEMMNGRIGEGERGRINESNIEGSVSDGADLASPSSSL